MPGSLFTYRVIRVLLAELAPLFLSLCPLSLFLPLLLQELLLPGLFLGPSLFILPLLLLKLLLPALL
ncbi:MAG TPA: hypothetical protein PLG94_14515, partial [Smithellaceae bacterium]|nr:hypothetical protein [Smithellaceae bacterium]